MVENRVQFVGTTAWVDAGMNHLKLGVNFTCIFIRELADL
jgi:hypothetical protein